MFVPTKVFFTRGVGRGKDELTSFESALRRAGIAPFNLVYVSSILPPNAEIIKKEKGLSLLKPGQIVFVVMSRLSSNEPRRLIGASVGCAIPKDKNTHGYLSEFHAYGMKEKLISDKAEDLAAEMLASTLNVPFDSNSSWDEKKQYFKLSGRIVKTTNITQSAIVDKRGMWTCVISCAVLLP